MEAFQYWRQPTWAYTTNDEPEKDYLGIIIHELERQREERLQEEREHELERQMEERLQEERERRLDNMIKSIEEDTRAMERSLQQERERRLDNAMKSMEKSFENMSKMMSEVILPYFKERSIVEEEKEEEAAEIPQSSAEFSQDEPNEPSCSSSSDTMTMPPHEDEEDETNKIVVNSFKPSLSIILIPFIADKADFDEDLQLSHAWRKSRSKTEKPKFKLRSCLNHLRYNLCGFNFLCPLSKSVFAQSSAATLDKLRRAWVRYKVPC